MYTVFIGQGEESAEKLHGERKVSCGREKVKEGRKEKKKGREDQASAEQGKHVVCQRCRTQSNVSLQSGRRGALARTHRAGPYWLTSALHQSDCH